MLSGMQELIVEWSSIIYIKSKQYHSVSVTNKNDIEERKFVLHGSYILHSLIKMEKGEGGGAIISNNSW